MKQVGNRKSHGYSGIYENDPPQTYKWQKVLLNTVWGFYDTNLIGLKPIFILLKLLLISRSTSKVSWENTFIIISYQLPEN